MYSCISYTYISYIHVSLCIYIYIYVCVCDLFASKPVQPDRPAARYLIERRAPMELGHDPEKFKLERAQSNNIFAMLLDAKLVG